MAIVPCMGMPRNSPLLIYLTYISKKKNLQEKKKVQVSGILGVKSLIFTSLMGICWFSIT